MTALSKRFLVVGGLFGAALLYAAPASAQATRTWVSGVGDDVNPCSRTAPCKTFAGAISKTATGGEINCLDPGGWGAVTITKSLTIDCSQFPGGILNAGSNGIIVNDSGAGTIVVVVRGLEINGGSTSTPGLNGIRFLSGASLSVEDVTIRGSTSSSSGAGILFQPSTAGKLFLKNVVIANNINGILVQPTGTGSAQVQLHDVSIVNNTGTGLRTDATGNTGTLGISIETNKVQITGNSVGMFLYAPAGNTVPTKLMSVDGTIAYNAGAGVLGNGTPITALFSNSTITGNGTGIAAVGATVLSYSDNRLFGNGSGNAFPGTLPKN